MILRLEQGQGVVPRTAAQLEVASSAVPTWKEIEELLGVKLSAHAMHLQSPADTTSIPLQVNLMSLGNEFPHGPQMGTTRPSRSCLPAETNAHLTEEWYDSPKNKRVCTPQLAEVANIKGRTGTDVGERFAHAMPALKACMTRVRC